MNSDKRKRAKRKAYMLSANPGKKRRTNGDLVAGLRGFVCTCNGNEKGCIREALNLLDEYNSKMNSKQDVEYDDQEEDIETALKLEIENEKTQKKVFKPLNTGINNCVFISSTVENNLELGESIMRDAKETKCAKSRFLKRIVPIEITCKAYNDDIKKAADSIFDHHFKGEPTTYCVNINKRSNNNLLRMDVINDLAHLVRDRNSSHSVDLKKAAKTIVVEIIRNICCIAVVNNYFEYQKYNLMEVASDKSPKGEVTLPDANPESGEVNSKIEELNNENVSEDVLESQVKETNGAVETNVDSTKLAENDLTSINQIKETKADMDDKTTKLTEELAS